MKAFWLLVLVPALAHAELYRWVDPDTGSVKFSSTPPTDARVKAESVPYGRGAPPAKAPKPSASATKPAAEPAAALASVEAQWRQALSQLEHANPEELRRNPELLRHYVEIYDATRTALDRLDPGGTARRQAEASAALARLSQALAAESGGAAKK